MSLHYEKEFHVVAVTLSVDTGCLLIPKLDKGNSAVVGAEMLGCIWERSKSLKGQKAFMNNIQAHTTSDQQPLAHHVLTKSNPSTIPTKNQVIPAMTPDGCSDIDFRDLSQLCSHRTAHAWQCQIMKETSGNTTAPPKSHKKQSDNDFKILYLIFSNE